MYVRWEGLGLGGFIGPYGSQKDLLYTFNELSGQPGSKKSMPLWYGAQPERIDVQTVVSSILHRRMNTSGLSHQGFGEAIVIRAAYGLSPQDHSHPRSSSHVIYVPRFEEIPSANAGSLEEIISYVEENPSVLQTFIMNFESSLEMDDLTKDGESIRRVRAIVNTCQYVLEHLPDTSDEGTIYIRFSDGEFHRKMTGQQHALGLNSGRWHAEGGHNGPEIELHDVELVDLDGTEIELKSTELHVLAPDQETVIGSMPVTYYVQRK